MKGHTLYNETFRVLVAMCQLPMVIFANPTTTTNASTASTKGNEQQVAIFENSEKTISNRLWSLWYYQVE